MRIAFIVTSFPCLSETFVLDQITGLIDRGHEVDVYAEERGAEFEAHPEVEQYDLLRRTFYEGLPRNRLRRLLKSPGAFFSNGGASLMPRLRALNVLRYGLRAGSLRLLYAASPLLGKPPYDIIQCHFGGNGSKGALVRDTGAAHGKLVTTFHGYDLSLQLRRHGRHLYDELFAKGDLFLPVTRRWKERLIEMSCPEAKIVVHRMGVNLEQFPFEPRCAPAGERCVVVSVARLVEKKGIEYGIRAVAKLCEEGYNVEYRIAGDGPLKPELLRLIGELNLRDVVKLLGWKRRCEVREILRAAHVFLAPSVTSEEGDEEGAPVSIMEAMATGLPVVGTRHSGLPELIREGVTGFLAPERDVSGLTDGLRRLVESPQSRVEMGRNGRLAVERQHDNRKLNDRLVNIYRRLLSQTN